MRESQNGGNKKHAKFSKKTNISDSLTCRRTLFVGCFNESKGTSQFLSSNKLHIYLELFNHF